VPRVKSRRIRSGATGIGFWNRKRRVIHRVGQAVGHENAPLSLEVPVDNSFDFGLRIGAQRRGLFFKFSGELTHGLTDEFKSKGIMNDSI